MSAEYAFETLRFDASNRYPGITCDLHPIEEWHVTEWKGELPTIVAKNPFKLGVRRSLDFRKRLITYFPEFAGFDWKNVCLAGGMVGLLLDENVKSSRIRQADLDLFVYGVNNDEEFYRTVEYAMQQLDVGDILSINRTSRFILYTTNERKYQFILRHYGSVSEVLHSFDLGSSAVAFTGKEVVATSLGKFAFETGCNLVNLERYSPSFEFRLVKYYQRGFSIVLPNLDMGSLDEAVVLGRLEVYITDDEIRGKTFEVYVVRGASDLSSDYEDESLDLTYPALYSFLKYPQHSFVSVPEAKDPSEAWTAPIPFTREELEEAIAGTIRDIRDGDIRLKRVKSLGLSHLLEASQHTLEYELENWKQRLLQAYDSTPRLPPITRASEQTMLGSFEPLACDIRKWYGGHYKNV